MKLEDAVRDLDQLPTEATIYIRRDDPDVLSTSDVLVVVPDEVPSGWRYLLEVLIAREVLEVWSSWREGRTPTLGEACDAVIYYAKYDAYQADEDDDQYDSA